MTSTLDGTDTTLRAQIVLHGFARIPAPIAPVTTEDLAAGLGEPLDPWGDGLVQRLEPRDNGPPNTYSGLFGLGAFPLHTDLAHWPVPPRYMLLRCGKGYADVPTLLLDGMEIVREMDADALERALVRPRRRQSGELRLLHLWSPPKRDTGCLRWDPVFLQPASVQGRRAFDALRDRLEVATPTQAVMIEPGEAIVIDNWRMLHARPAIPAGRRDRYLQRVYLRSLH